MFEEMNKIVEDFMIEVDNAIENICHKDKNNQ